MIFSNYTFQSRCYLVIIFAFIIQYLYIWTKQQDHTILSDEARSAIKRAKSDVCKNELREFALKSLIGQKHQPIYLRRDCPHDLKEERNLRLGCVSNNTSNLISIEKYLSDPIECLDRCFSYGHGHGGLKLEGNVCYCGDIDETIPLNTTKHCNQDEVDLYKVNNGIHNPKTNSLLKQVTGRSDRLKIVFLLTLNGRYTSQVRRLLRNIFSPNHIYYIHVDPREEYLFEDLSQLESKYANIMLARSRFETIWGGPRLLTMMVDAMKNLVHHQWDYLINLSETDFPIKNITQLEHYLATHGSSIYLKKHNMKGYNFIQKQGLEWDFYQCENRVWRLGKRRLPRGIIFTGGSDWVALPKGFCNYILESMDDDQGLIKQLLDLYNHTLLPAESFFHTAALNGKFCDKIVDNNLRITNWQRKQGCKCQHKNIVDWCGCSPLVYRWSDWTRLERTRSMGSVFFSRKFEPTISSSIINTVEQHLVYDNQQAPRTDTRFWYLTPHDLSINPYLQRFANLTFTQIFQSDTEKVKFKKNIHLYFNQDRFVGLIISYCDMFEGDCGQMLIENKKEFNSVDYNQDCLSKAGRQLKAIEVNQGFDTGERMFRNYLPLNTNSSIEVYHEWLVTNATEDKITFVWVSPKGTDTRLIQDIKFKKSSKLKKISLVHRMNIRKPLASGLWTLEATINEELCLRYQFLVFGSESTNVKGVFNKFYQVTDHCTFNSRKVDNNRTDKDCHNHEWSLENMRASNELYGLN